MKACKRLLLLVAPVVLVALLLGCSGTPAGRGPRSGLYGLDVSSDVGTAPTVRMVTPLAVTRTASETVVAGTGAPVQIDQLFVLQLSLYDARTGKRAASTYDPGQTPLLTKSSDDRLFPQLTKALLGKRQGSRIAVALRAADAYGAGVRPPAGISPDDAVVVIADVVAVPPTKTLTTATGTARQAAAGSPRVAVLDGDPTGVSFPAGRQPPRDLVVVPLITGTGPPVRAHSLVTLDYLGQARGSRGPFADTYFKEPAVVPVGAEGSLPAWDAALVGVRRGSRVLIIDPRPASGGAPVVRAPEHATIAWVIDVLGVS